MKIKNLLTTLGALAIVTVVTFIGCKKDTYEQIDGVCPKVLSTSPFDGETGVAQSKVITITFNEEMNPESITNESIIITGSVVAGVVTYAGKTATFTPTSPLIANHTYTGRVTTAVRDLMGNSLQKDYVWTFSTGALLSPVVITTDPANLATGVVLNKVVSATFNMPMNPSTLKDTTFILRQGTTKIAGTVTYIDTTAYFTPSVALLSGTTYTATITTGAKNLAGTGLASNYTWSFTTGILVAPTVISTDPANLATNVPLNKIITATFSEAMNPLTISGATYTLKQGANLIAGTVTYSGTTATFTPSVALLSGTTYTATITTGAKNLAGTSLAGNYIWTFTTVVTTPPVAPTVISTDPANLATGVVLTKIISATFSVPMNVTTITGTTFTLKQGTTSIAGIVTYASSTAYFTPTANLLPGLTYTATVTTGAKDLAGTALAANYTWTFTTLVLIAPTVISTNPIDLATGVPVNKVITATFSVPMDATTINTSTFTLKQGTTAITGVVTYSGSTATFTPSANLTAGKVYTATITNGVKNVAGTNMVNDYIWSFTTVVIPPTVISTDPTNGATNVALNKVITADFSTAMDPTTITSTTFTVKIGSTAVAGTVSYSGVKATFTPTANLLSGNTYTATITTGAKDLAGTSLVSNYVWTFSTKAPAGPTAPDLKSAGNFGILAYSTVTNNAGASEINNMDVGVYPGTAVTGFPPGKVNNGAIYTANSASPIPALLIQAKADLTAAYNYAEGASSPAPATVSGNQGGKTLYPGIYKSTSTLSVDGSALTLDAQGDVNAVWIFQVASTFITTTGGSIVLSGGAQAKNIYWQVGSSATIGDNTTFYGNVLALISITMNTNATATGRMLTQTGAVTLTSTNIINKP
jgi:hypothetical protein